MGAAPADRRIHANEPDDDFESNARERASNISGPAVLVVIHGA